jgi:hypothetical protein
MRNFRRQTLLFVALLAFTGNASMADSFWIGAKAGTLGVGIEGTWRPIDWLDLRVGANKYDYDDSGAQAGVNYNGTLHLETYYATANFRFPLSPFRISAGYYSNNNSVELASINLPAHDIGGTVFSLEDVGTVRSNIDWNSSSPYVGAGFDFEIFGKVGLTFDFGVLLQGDPKVELTADGLLSGSQVLIDALEIERAELEDEADSLKAYPVLSLGFNFNF